MSSAPVSQSASFRLEAPLERVFPLFTAEGERAWAVGWDPEMLSGTVERGSVFRTRMPDRPETVWIVADYQPDQGRVSYARLALGSNMGLVDVHCRRDGAVTEVSVRYTLTGLDAEGEHFVAGFLAPARYAAMIDGWRLAAGDGGGSGLLIRHLRAGRTESVFGVNRSHRRSRRPWR